MRKAISIILTIGMLLTLCVLAVSASGGELVTTASAPTNTADWIITEISQDQTGNGIGGYSDGKDCFEFYELYNNSGKALNLYDYCITYNGNGRTSEKFETQIVEITPIKAGSFLDGTTLPWSGQDNLCSDLSNLPVNPDTCTVEAGEVVVLWSVWHESVYAMFNDGKGLSEADFRAFWNIPEGVKVIAVDGFSNTGYGGNDKNFNIKNSATGTYGIALYTEEINTAANTTSGGDANYAVNYTDCPELEAWATMDFNTQLGTSSANYTTNFTLDSKGYGAAEWGLVPDARRMVLIESFSEPSVGTLTTFQKLTLGAQLDAGEKLEISDMNYYFPSGDELGDFQGLEINGTLYPLGSTFTAASAGTYTAYYVYGEQSDTTPPDTEPVTEPATEPDTDTEPVTEPVTEPTTEKPADDTTTAAPSDDDGGCGSVVAFGLLACAIPAAVVIAKKKKN